jgi:hypothetical protein
MVALFSVTWFWGSDVCSSLLKALVELGTTPKLSTDTELRMATVITRSALEIPILVMVLSMFDIVIDLFLFYDAMVKDLRSYSRTFTGDISFAEDDSI